MGEAFDPYFKWLSIPPEEQPPHLYRLLGVPLFVADLDVISNAADRQMSHLRTYQTGPNSVASQKLLNEISQARLCLLNPQRKAAYDEQLRAKLKPRPTPSETPAPQAVPVAPAAPANPYGDLGFDSVGASSRQGTKKAKSQPQQQRKWLMPAIVGVVVLLIVSVTAIAMLRDGGSQPTVAKIDPPVAKVEPVVPSQPPAMPPAVENPPPAKIAPAAPVVPPVTVEPKPPVQPAPATEVATAPVVQPPVVAPVTRPVVPPVAPLVPPAGDVATPPPPRPAVVKPPVPAHAEVPAKLVKAPFDAGVALAYQEAWAKRLGIPVETTNSLGMKFRVIPPGEFQMGTSPEDFEKSMKLANAANFQTNDEGPQHRVVLTEPYLVCVTEVTMGQFQKFLDDSNYVTDKEKAERAANAAKVVHYKMTPDLPVFFVPWDQAAAFCVWLSAREKLDKPYDGAGDNWTVLPGNGYRLPTEAQWEFACRAGTTSMFLSGDTADRLQDHGWLNLALDGTCHPRPVGSLEANAFGLFDMAGNAFEWCQDFYDPGYYAKSPTENPPGGSAGNRVLRSTSWAGQLFQTRIAYRHNFAAPVRSAHIGFRVTRTLDPEQTAANTVFAGEETNLLEQIELLRDKVTGVWKLEKGSLVSPALPGSRLQLPAPPGPNYSLTAVVQRVRGADAMVLGLVIGGRQAAASIDLPNPYRSSLSDVGGGKLKEANDINQLAAVMTTDDPYTIVYTVRGNRVVVTVDGKAVIDWSGDVARLSNPTKLRVPDPAALYLATNSSFRISKLTIVPLTDGSVD